MSSSTEHASSRKFDRGLKEFRKAQQIEKWLKIINLTHSEVLLGLLYVNSASTKVVRLGSRRFREKSDGIKNMEDSVRIFNELRVKVRDTIAFVDTIVQNYSATAHIIQYNGNDQIKVLLKDVDLEEMPENANPGVACVNRMRHLYWIVVKLLDAKKEHVKTAKWCASGDKSAHVDSTSAGVGRRF